MTRAGASIGFIAKGYAPPRNANIADAVSVPVGTHSDNQSRGVGESRPEREARHGPIGECDNPDARVATWPARQYQPAPETGWGRGSVSGAARSRILRHSIQIARRSPSEALLQADDILSQPGVVRTYSNPDRLKAPPRRFPPCDRQTGCANAAFLIHELMRHRRARLENPRRDGSQARTWTGCRITGRVPLPGRVCEPVHHALHNRVEPNPSHSAPEILSHGTRRQARSAATPNDNMPSVLQHNVGEGRLRHAQDFMARGSDEFG